MDAILKTLSDSGWPAGFVLVVLLGGGVVTWLLRDRARLIEALVRQREEIDRLHERQREELGRLHQARLTELREALIDSRLFGQALERARGKSYSPPPSMSGMTRRR